MGEGISKGQLSPLWGHHCNYIAVHFPGSVLLPTHSLLHRYYSEIATSPEQKTPWIESPSLNVFPREFCLWFANRLQTTEEDMIQKLNFNKRTFEFLLSEMEYMMGGASLIVESEVKFWTYYVWDNFKHSSERTK